MGGEEAWEWHDGFVYKAEWTSTEWIYFLYIVTDGWTDLQYKPEKLPVVDKTVCFVRHDSASKKFPKRWTPAEQQEVRRVLAAARATEAAEEAAAAPPPAAPAAAAAGRGGRA